MKINREREDTDIHLHRQAPLALQDHTITSPIDISAKVEAIQETVTKKEKVGQGPLVQEEIKIAGKDSDKQLMIVQGHHFRIIDSLKEIQI